MESAQLTSIEREQELRMRCLEMANRSPHGGISEVLDSARKMYNFAMAAPPAPPAPPIQKAA